MYFISISCNFKFVSHKKLAYACWSFFLWAWIVRGTQSSTMQVKIIWESAVEWFQQHGCCYNFSGLIFRRSYSRGFKTSTNAFIFPSKENRLSAYELRPFVGASRQSHLIWLLKEDDGMWEKKYKASALPWKEDQLVCHWQHGNKYVGLGRKNLYWFSHCSPICFPPFLFCQLHYTLYKWSFKVKTFVLIWLLKLIGRKWDDSLSSVTDFSCFTWCWGTLRCEISLYIWRNFQRTSNQVSEGWRCTLFYYLSQTKHKGMHFLFLSHAHRETA